MKIEDLNHDAPVCRLDVTRFEGEALRALFGQMSVVSRSEMLRESDVGEWTNERVSLANQFFDRLFDELDKRFRQPRKSTW